MLYEPPLGFNTTAARRTIDRTTICIAHNSSYPCHCPSVPTARTNAVVYGLAAVGCRGRVADLAVVHVLG
jgi:hypothetical protein